MITKWFMRKKLDKWPIISTIGRSITPEQATNLIIRTTDFSLLFTNDRPWQERVEKLIYGNTVREIEKIEENEGNISYANSKIRRTGKEKMLFLEGLQYLQNSERIASCSFCALHGFADWNGNFTGNYIGLPVKWPTTEELFYEWKMIAETFPYLDIQCTIFNWLETNNNIEKLTPIVTYVICEGKVNVKRPVISNREVLSSEMIFEKLFDQVSLNDFSHEHVSYEFIEEKIKSFWKKNNIKE